jgi:hypothetical protein
MDGPKEILHRLTKLEESSKNKEKELKFEIQRLKNILIEPKVTENKKIAYIYMVCLKDDIVKIGMTMQEPDNVIKRIKAYPKGSTISFVTQVAKDSVRDIERELCSIFTEKFTLVKGIEFFKGDKNEMASVAQNYIISYDL